MPTLERARPNVVTITTTNPAATGVEHSYMFLEDLWIKYFQVALVTDGNAANRAVEFTFEDASGNVFHRLPAGGTQAASLTRQYCARPGDFSSPAVANTTFILTLPRDGIFVPKGGKIKTVTTSVQATDDYGVMTLRCER